MVKKIDLKKALCLIGLVMMFGILSACGGDKGRESTVEDVEQGTAETEEQGEETEESQEQNGDIQNEEAANNNGEENADNVVDSADSTEEMNDVVDFEEFIKNHNAYEYPLESFCRALKEINEEFLAAAYGTFFMDYMVNTKGYKESDVLWEYRDLCVSMNVEFSEEYGTDFDVSYEYDGKLCDEGELQSIYQKLTEEYGFKGELEEAYRGYLNLNLEGEKGTGSKEVGKAVVGKLDGQWHILPPDI